MKKTIQFLKWTAIFLAVIQSVFMGGLYYLAHHSLSIKRNHFLVRYLPSFIHFDNAVLKTSNFYSFPTLEIHNFCLKNDSVAIRASYIKCTWRIRDILTGRFYPGAVTTHQPDIHIFAKEEQTDDFKSFFNILEDFFVQIPMEFLEATNGLLKIDFSSKPTINVENLDLMISKKIMGHEALVHGIFHMGTHSIPFTTKLKFNPLRESIDGTISVEKFNLRILPINTDAFVSIKNFYPYAVSSHFSFSLSKYSKNQNKKFTFFDLFFYSNGYIKIDLDSEKTIDISLNMDWDPKDKKLSLKTKIPRMNKDDLFKLWFPSDLFLRKWIFENFHQGEIHDFLIHGDFFLEPNFSFKTRALEGNFIIKKGIVTYKNDLLPLINLNGQAYFDLKKFNMEIKSAFIENLEIKDSRVILNSQDNKEWYATLQLNVVNSLSSLFSILNHSSLDLNINNTISDVSGFLDGNAFIKFPLKDKLQRQDIHSKGQFKISDVSFRLKIPNQPPLNLSKTKANLTFDSENLVVEGETFMNSLHNVFCIKKNFSDTVSIKDALSIKTKGDVKHIFAFLPKWISDQVKIDGNIDLEYDYSKNLLGLRDINIRLNFSDTNAIIPFINWNKTKGLPGILNVSYSTQEDMIQNLKDFHVKSKKLDVKGKMTFSDGQISSFSLSPFKFNNSVGLFKGHKIKDTWKIKAELPYLYAEFLRKIIKEPLKNDSSSSRLCVDFSGQIKKLFLSNSVVLSNFKIDSILKNRKLNFLNIESQNEKERVKIFYRLEDGFGKISCFLSHPENLLKGLNVNYDIKGKNLRLEGQKSSLNHDSPLEGTLTIEQIKVGSAPLLTKILGLISIDGLLNHMTGEGLVFNENEAIFSYKDKKLFLKKTKIMNSSLGITAKGNIDFEKEELDLEGVLVPANFFNQLLGKVPLIGTILSAGQSENGVFSVSYQAKGRFKNISVRSNPLGILAPTFIKSLFK